MTQRRKTPLPTGGSGSPSLLVGIGALVLLAVAAVFLWPRGEAPASIVGTAGGLGRLVATAPLVDLGRVPFDSMVEARYELVNTGSSAVRLLGQPEVKTLEGC